jgi:hypothetical protein
MYKNSWMDIHLHYTLAPKVKISLITSHITIMSYQNGYNGMPMQGGGGGYGGGYGGSSGGNFPPGMRPFNGGSPGFNNRGGGRGRGRRGKLHASFGCEIAGSRVQMIEAEAEGVMEVEEVTDTLLKARGSGLGRW